MASNFTLSIELIYLLEWLLEHEKTRLKGTIKKAIQNGLAQKLETAASPRIDLDNEQLQDTFLEFLIFLEQTLMETMEESDHNHTLRSDLAHTFHRLSLASVDPQTALSCLHEAEVALEKKTQQASAPAHPSEDEMTQTLLTKFLKNWKPSKQDPVN